jgi:UDP-GlcNAc:undecaprenyl-phosphate GlcNAc-1-phosphate transferase
MSPTAWQAFVLAFVSSALTAPLVIALYKKIGWLDDPLKNPVPKTVHTTPVPRGGGLVVAAGILAVFCAFIPLTQAMSGVLMGATILLISGTLDDRYDINPYFRYVLNILAALCVIGSGIGIDYVTNPFGSGVIHLNTIGPTLTLGNQTFSIFADGLALLWIVWNMNAVNWSKGVDGQMPGFVAIAAFFIALLSLRFQGDQTQGVVTLLSLAVSGAYAGFLLWNAYPQKMMPGYAGGSLAGFFLSVLAILSGAKIATALLLLALPMVDGLYTVARRIASGRSPFWGDRGHLHHKMLDAGWGRRRIAFFYWITTFLFGAVALQLDSRSKAYAMMASGILFLLLVLWLKRSITFSKPPARVSGSKT